MQDFSSLNADKSPVQTATAAQKPSRRKMPMTLINFWLDAALLLSVVFLVWVSVMMYVVFPDATVADGWKLWGLSFDQWRDAQFFALCVAALLALEHLVLHWSWVCGVITTKILRVKNRPDEGIQAVYGVATFIGVALVILSSIIAAILTVERPPTAG